jgi:type IX secretion system PorP/SprF family membrane protein
MKKFLLFILIPVWGSVCAQQDPQYSMYQFNQMLINPAFAGSRDGVSAVASGRQQWVGFEGAPRTTALSVHGPIAKKHIGVGLTLLNDVMGARNVIGVYGNFSYILKLGNTAKLSFGVNAGYNKYQFNFGKINFNEAEVPSQLLSTQDLGALDINSGIYFKTKNFYLGVSASHLNNPKVYSYEPVVTGAGKYVYRVNVHMFYTAGYSFIFNKNFILAPTVLVKQVNSLVSADVNLNTFLYKKLWLGVFYRTAFGPGGLLQYYITENFRVGYSFDTGLGDAMRLGGSHELMIGFDFGKPATNQKVSNPRFL